MVKNLLKPVKTQEKIETKIENEFEAIKLRKTEMLDDKSQLKSLQSNGEKDNEFRKVKLRKTETEASTNNEKENQSSKSKFVKKNCQNNSRKNILRSASPSSKKSLESQEMITDVRDVGSKNINLGTKESSGGSYSNRESHQLADIIREGGIETLPRLDTGMQSNYSGLFC